MKNEKKTTHLVLIFQAFSKFCMKYKPLNILLKSAYSLFNIPNIYKNINFSNFLITFSLSQLISKVYLVKNKNHKEKSGLRN